jgi:hypothetical protein
MRCDSDNLLHDTSANTTAATSEITNMMNKEAFNCILGVDEKKRSTPLSKDHHSLGLTWEALLTEINVLSRQRTHTSCSH